ncbi:MAG: ArnT family glycosyltransferase [bacterium]
MIKLKQFIHKNKNILLLIILLIISFTRMYNLGCLEIQPWDEAMYAIRAKAAALNNQWFDQTDYSVGGLYSSSHPPIFIWLTALGFKIFGVSSFSVRLWSSLMGIGILIFLFFIPSRRKAGFLAALILATNAFFNSYTRQGQLDIAYIFFIVAGLWFWIKFEKTDQKKYLLVTGFIFGLALMSKIIVGLFFIISLTLYKLLKFIYKQTDLKNCFIHLLVIFSVGLLTALPWHLFMLIKYGNSFVNFFLFFHLFERTLTGVESNTQSLGYFFYINQIIILMPVITVLIIYYWKLIFPPRKNKMLLYFCFFIVPFIIFSLSQTKLRTYSLVMLPFMSLLGGELLLVMWSQKKIHTLIPLFALLFIFWSQFPQFRYQLKYLSSNWLHQVIAVDILWLCLTAAIIVFNRKMDGKKWVLTFLSITVLTSFTSETRLYYQGNLKFASELFFQHNYNTLIYVDNQNSITNPQINYYFNGIDRGLTGNEYTFIRIYPSASANSSLPELEPGCMIIFNQWHYLEDFKAIENYYRSNYKLDIIVNNEFYRIYKI